jgi:hypothetical protein
LKWNTKFGPKWTGRYSRAQIFIDSEVLRLSEPFTPLLTGTLIKSGILGTDIGSGKVQWIAPYSKSQYYHGRLPGTGTNINFGPGGATIQKTASVLPTRGRFWFERMKEIHGSKIIKGAKRIAGGEGK